MFRIFPKDNKTPQVSIEQLYEDEYKTRLITQIQKAAEKGYDISTISPDVDIDKLKEAISSLSSESPTSIGLLSILFATKGHSIEELTSVTAIDNAYRIIAEYNDKINPLCYNAVNAKGDNVKRINDVAMKALRQNVDMYDYLKRGFNTGEIEQIVIGLEKKVNIDKYLDTSLDRDRISALVYINDQQKRHNLFTPEQLDAICNRKYTLRTINKLIAVRKSNYDISAILEVPLDTKQSYSILTAIGDGLNVSPMLNERLNTQQLNSIYMGLKKGIDVTLYAKEGFTNQQMDVIRTALSYNKDHCGEEIDITPILNESISAELMKKYLKVKEQGDLDDVISVLKDIEKVSNIKQDEIIKER